MTTIRLDDREAWFARNLHPAHTGDLTHNPTWDTWTFGPVARQRIDDIANLRTAAELRHVRTARRILAKLNAKETPR